MGLIYYINCSVCDELTFIHNLINTMCGMCYEIDEYDTDPEDLPALICGICHYIIYENRCACSF